MPVRKYRDVKMHCVNFRLVIGILFLAVPQMILSSDGFLGSSVNDTTEPALQRKFNLPGTGLLMKVAERTKSAGNYIVHRGHYDDGVTSELVEYNVSDAVPSFAGKVIEKVSKTAGRVGKALHLIPHKIETDGLDTNTTFFSGVVSSFKNHLKAIYPGTQWCGDGDRARSYDDLGTFKSTDMCCRDHDKCPDGIQSKQTKHGLNNTGLFTRSHCSCDEKFYKCLQDSGTLVSKKIGFTYFTVLGPQCFKEEYPIIGCVQYTKGKCIEYHLDNSTDKIYQWFDSPPFRSKFL